MAAAAKRSRARATDAGRQVALFRGINVGRAKRVAMADLRALAEELGYRDARTLLNSGNLVFTGGRADAATRIEKAMAARLGVRARVIGLTAAELDEIVAGNPLLKPGRDPSRMMAAVLSDPADRKKLAPLATRDWKPDALALGRRVAYVWCAGGLLESETFAAVSQALGDAVTVRNWATLTKLHALVHGDTEAAR